MKLLSGFYIFVKVVLVILLLILCAVPLYYVVKFIQKSNKTIKIYPKFEIVEIKNNYEVDVATTEEVIRIGKEVLDRVKQK